MYILQLQCGANVKQGSCPGICLWDQRDCAVDVSLISVKLLTLKNNCLNLCHQERRFCSSATVTVLDLLSESKFSEPCRTFTNGHDM